MIGLSDRYIGRQVLVGTIFTVVLLSVVLILGNLFKEIRPILVEQRGPLTMILRFILHVIPFSLMFTVPWGFLASVLLVFGRLSSDNELHAFQMAGFSLTRLAAPVFALGGLFTGLCWWLNVDVVPRARSSLDTMLYEFLMKDPRALLNPGAVQSRFKDLKVFVERKDGATLRGLHLYQIGGGDDAARPRAGEPQKRHAYVHSGAATLVIDHAEQKLRAILDDAYLETFRADGTPEIVFASQAKHWLFDFSSERQRKVRAKSMTNRELSRRLAAGEFAHDRQRAEFRTEIRRRHAFSMASFALAFIGVPLGINARRKDTSTGLVLSLLIGGAYFLFSTLATEWQGLGERSVQVLLWTPNAACIALGLLLFRHCRLR